MGVVGRQPSQLRLGGAGQEVAAAVASVGSTAHFHGGIAAGAQVGAVRGHGGGRLAGHLAQDEARLIVVFQVGDVLHHPTLLVGDGQGVGAVGHEVELPEDEDQGQREGRQDDQGDEDGHGPRWVEQELFGSLEETELMSRGWCSSSEAPDSSCCLLPARWAQVEGQDPHTGCWAQPKINTNFIWLGISGQGEQTRLLPGDEQGRNVTQQERKER